jgi:Uma2 family endonuclease
MPTLAPPKRTRRRPATPIALDDMQHFVFEDASWAFYERMLREVGNRPIRLNYDDGRLEVMSPLPEHELGKRAVGRLVEQLTLELNIPMASFGSTTFRRRDRRKGVEPDECYYLANEARMRGRKRLNLRRDPPPDLVVEMDVTSSSVPREPIYAGLGVPELWRSNGRRVQCLHLIDQRYQPRKHSLCLPFLDPAELQPFVAMCDVRGETAALLQFIKWVRKQKWPTAGA